METDRTHPHSAGWTAWLLLAAVVAGGAWLRYQRIGFDSISLDEMWNLTLSTGRGSPQMTWPSNEVLRVEHAFSDLDGAPPWWRVWTGMERVLHPPLFVLTLRLWREAFGDGDAAAQWYVAVWSLAAVVATFDLVRTLTRGNTAAGLWAATILAVAPMQIAMGQEVRSYAMLAALTAMAMSVAARIDVLGFTRRRAMILAATLLAMMLTHYFALGACLGFAAWASTRLRERALVETFAAITGAAILFGVTWGPLMLRQIPDVGATADPWLKESADGSGAAAIQRFVALPARLLVERLETPAAIPTAETASLSPPAHVPPPAWVGMGAVVLIAGAIVAVRHRRRYGKLFATPIWLPFLVFAGAGGFLLALDLVRSTRHLVFIRYALAGAPAVAAILAIIPLRSSAVNATRALATPALHVLAGLLVIALLAMNRYAYEPEEPDWRVLRRFMLESVAPNETMVFFSGPAVKGYFNEILMLAASREPRLFPRDMVKLMEPADANLIGSLRSDRVWMFSGPVGDVRQVLPGVRVIEQQVLRDQNGLSVAVCTLVERTGG